MKEAYQANIVVQNYMELVEKFNTYHYGAREFDFIQLQMLVAAVSSARFLSDKKSQELIEKLSDFTSAFQKRKLQA